MNVINCYQTRNETENHNNDWIVYRPRNQQREVLELCHAFKSNVSFIVFVIKLYFAPCIDPITDVARNELWDSLRQSDDAAKHKKCRIVVLYGDVIMITSALICR